MRRTLYILFSAIIVIFIITIVLYPIDNDTTTIADHHTENGFRNPFKGYHEKSFGDFLFWILIDRAKNGREKGPDDINFPVVNNDGKLLKGFHQSPTFTWIGHSTFLIQVGDINILTDPVWSERASPFSFAGPKRYVRPGLKFNALPDIDIVIISHDHYDHLDLNTIKKLGNKPLYIVPLGVEERLADIDITNVESRDWWESIEFHSMIITSVPAQHFSGRTMFDRNSTLWCGWVIQTPGRSIYFAGDTGYFPGFREIRENFGKIDIAMLPIGAYKPRWFMGPVHIDPVEAVRAYIELDADIFIGMHWGTFPLADEEMDEPPRALFEEVDKIGLERSEFNVFKHGESRVFKLY